MKGHRKRKSKMNQSDLFEEEPRLFENLCSTIYLTIGFEQVKKNKGKPGIDGVSIMDFEASLDEELSHLQQELGLTNPRPYVELKYPSRKAKGCDYSAYRRYEIVWYKQR
jgi:hypothetical protein